MSGERRAGRPRRGALRHAPSRWLRRRAMRRPAPMREVRRQEVPLGVRSDYRGVLTNQGIDQAPHHLLGGAGVHPVTHSVVLALLLRATSGRLRRPSADVRSGRGPRAPTDCPKTPASPSDARVVSSSRRTTAARPKEERGRRRPRRLLPRNSNSELGSEGPVLLGVVEAVPWRYGSALMWRLCAI